MKNPFNKHTPSEELDKVSLSDSRATRQYRSERAEASTAVSGPSLSIEKLFPAQLRDKKFKFVLVYPKSKQPVGNAWQKKGLSYDDPKLIEHLQRGGNYGVLGGHGGLVIVDCDTPEFAQRMVKEFKTFGVESGSGGRHFYLYCDLKNTRRFAEKYGELRTFGSQTVGPGSVHPNGKKYYVCDDLPIQRVEADELLKLIKPYLTGSDDGQHLVPKDQPRDESRSGIEYREVLKRMSRGMGDEEIYQNMMCFDKWAHAPEQYRKLTIQKARNFFESKKNIDTDYHQFILDSTKLSKDKIFVFDKLSDSVAAYGLMLPKWVDRYDKGGKFLRREQQHKPALITSDRKIIPVGDHVKDYKITFRDIPSELKLRWSLESIKEYIDGNSLIGKEPLKKIYDIIFQQYKKYISMPNEWVSVHVLWDIATYLFPLFRVFPIFELRGISGTAKTKAMSLSGLITFNSTGVMINPSEATLFRETNDTRPTKYIDEAESLFRIVKGKVEADPRVEVINSSYRYDGAVPRQEKIGNKFRTVWYRTYSPTMVASINGLYGATENRAIIRICTKSPQKDKRGELEPDPDAHVWQEIRNSLYVFALTNWRSVYRAYCNYENNTGLRERDYWLWLPLLVLGKEVSEDLYQTVLKVAKRQQSTKTADQIPDGSTDYKILETAYIGLLKEPMVYVKDIRDSLPESQYTPKEKTISDRLDKLGFRDYRKKDRNGSYFEIPKNVFTATIAPICPLLFSSQSSQSSQDDDNIDDKQEKLGVTNRDECDESNKKSRDECDENDECDGGTVMDTRKNVDGKPNPYQAIKARDQGQGAAFEDLKADMKVSENLLQEYINYGLKIGKIFEPSPGRYKLL